MTTATDILTELKELWEGAEPGPFGADDAIIIQYANGEYSVRGRAGYDSEGEKIAPIRILERAKPKAPEWEAVVASCINDGNAKREVYHLVAGEMWESNTRYISRDALVDPVPLVELPEREALTQRFHRVWSNSSGEWPGSNTLADAVLELLRGER